MKIILASKSGVRKEILDKYGVSSEVVVSNVDEDQIKEALLADKATPLIISKNLAEIKSITVSNKKPDRLVLGADSVISLNNELINKPKSREEALQILKKLNNCKHYLISLLHPCQWDYRPVTHKNILKYLNTTIFAYRSPIRYFP